MSPSAAHRPGPRPWHRPAEAGGLTSRELLEILHGLASCHLASADLVEVAPAYDHAEITSAAAAHTAYELTTIMAGRSPPPANRPGKRKLLPGHSHIIRAWGGTGR